MCPDLWIASLLFDLNLNLLTGASLLALAKSIYYLSLIYGFFVLQPSKHSAICCNNLKLTESLIFTCYQMLSIFVIIILFINKIPLCL